MAPCSRSLRPSQIDCDRFFSPDHVERYFRTGRGVQLLEGFERRRLARVVEAEEEDDHWRGDRAVVDAR